MNIMNETKSHLFKKINKIALATLTNPKTEKRQLSFFRNNRGNHCRFSAIEKIRRHYKQIYMYKSENLEKNRLIPQNPQITKIQLR